MDFLLLFINNNMKEKHQHIYNFLLREINRFNNRLNIACNVTDHEIVLFPNGNFEGILIHGDFIIQDRYGNVLCEGEESCAFQGYPKRCFDSCEKLKLFFMFGVSEKFRMKNLEQEILRIQIQKY